jgi:hypothetical protein
MNKPIEGPKLPEPPGMTQEEVKEEILRRLETKRNL